MTTNTRQPPTSQHQPTADTHQPTADTHQPTHTNHQPTPVTNQPPTHTNTHQHTHTMRLRDVHVEYRVYEESASALKQSFARGKMRRRHRTIHAVQGVTLDVYESETLGLIGANGSGKTTLLAAMTGLLPIKSGTIHGRSRPSLLGVSSALRPALSGRRNILIGGLAMGFTKTEITERMDDIISFTRLADAIDRPMGTYSSGMRARLHFAIATAKSPEILLIDEAMAVGDEEFRRASAARIDEIRQAAGSVVLVAHNMAEIQRSCDRVAWLDSGQIRDIGDPDAVIKAYLASSGS